MALSMLAFVHIEKTAGQTIIRILRRSLGVHHCDVEPWCKSDDFFSAKDYRLLQRLYPRLRSIAGHKVKPYSDLDQACESVRYFTFLRHPVVRCASNYQFQVQKMGKRISFDDWIALERYQNLHTRKIAGAADLESAIEILESKFCFVGLVEAFDESLLMLRLAVNAADIDIRYRRANVASDNRIKNELLSNPGTRESLVAANQIDLALYNYVKREIWSRQRQDYRGPLNGDVGRFQEHVEPRVYHNANMILNRLKRNALYKPARSLYRRCLTLVG